MEASKRPADENGSNGDSTEAKKAKLDPSCGALLFCGTTEWHNVRIFLIQYWYSTYIQGIPNSRISIRVNFM